MATSAPGRNDPCPCGSGRKYKHCCIARVEQEETARRRLRDAEARVVEGVFKFAIATWGEALLHHAWEDFWNYEAVPEDITGTPEFESTFTPWFVFEFVPDADVDEAADDWPAEPLAVAWRRVAAHDLSPLDAAYLDAACRSPMSVFVVEDVTPGRSVDLRDVLTGARFHVLELSASRQVQRTDLVFTRVVTVDDVSLMLGFAPYVVPPSWHVTILDWRDQMFGTRRMPTRRDVAEIADEIRDWYFEITDELLDPTPPQLANTDGDPIELTTLTFDLATPIDEAFEALAPMARLPGAEFIEDETRDASGALVAARLSWVKTGNRKIKSWDNTILGHLRLEGGQLIAEVNSHRRAERLTREIAKRLGRRATLVETAVADLKEALATAAGRSGEDAPRDREPFDESPEARDVRDAALGAHWVGWLDERIPALGKLTPRQAAASARGRERLDALLADFERHDSGQRVDGVPVARWLRAQLGLS
jgi:hypothetical protein